jgi:hypothetical protein
MAKMITAMIIKDGEPINSVVLSSDNADEWFANYDGTCVVPDPEDDFGTEFITLTGCIAFDVTGMEPMPGIGNGWSYVDGEWVPPITLEPVQ